MSRAEDWPEFQYNPATCGKWACDARVIFQKYHDLATHGGAENMQPDLAKIMDIERANKAIEILLAQQAHELESSYANLHWPFATRPAESLRRLPDAAKLALFQELVDAYKSE